MASCSKSDSSTAPVTPPPSLTGYWYFIASDDTTGNPEFMVFADVRDSAGLLRGTMYFAGNDGFFELPINGTHTAAAGAAFSLSVPEAEYNAQLTKGKLYDSAGVKAVIFSWKDSDSDTGSVAMMPLEISEEEEGFARKNSSGLASLLKEQPKTPPAVASLKKRFGSGNIPVVFIHGMNSNEKTWDNMMSNLESRGKGSSISAYTFEYNWTQSITSNGERLQQFLSDNGISNPVLVGHSMGGLVARAAVKAGVSVREVVTIGTPHQGSPLASLANVFTWLAGQGVGDAGQGSAFVNALAADSRNQALINNNKLYAFDAKMTGYYEYVLGFIPVWKWNGDYDFKMKVAYNLLWAGSGDNDGLVPSSSARAAGLTAASVNTDHTGIIQPSRSSTIANWIANRY